jgi:hypothetical protein
MARQQMMSTKQKQPVTTNSLLESPDFRIAIDFGTTFTAVAFAKRDARTDCLTIDQFPGDRHPGLSGTQVPTEIWYLSEREPDTVSEDTESVEPDLLYGYEVTRRLELPESHDLRTKYKDSGLITRPKLLLDETAYLRDMRAGLKAAIRQLKKDKLIKKDEDVIAHLLACFLKHTKSVLERDHGFNTSSTGKFIAMQLVQADNADITYS